jgi:small conductance mechanosensitive channel
MDNETRLRTFGELMATQGLEVVRSLLVLIVGLLLLKWIMRGLRNALGKVIKNTVLVSIISNIVGILLLSIVITAASLEAGLKLDPVVNTLVVVCLAAVGVVILFRPFIPSLPLKVGQTVKAGNLLGKIEAITILNTRLKTFDGKTFFVPNRKILGDIIINYHITQTRRIKLNVGIRYDQDLMKAKQVLEAIMIADPRVKAKPAPVVYVLNLANNCVELGGRCWVDNAKYWDAKCDLVEKTKFGFDHAGLVIAYPQLDIHHYNNEAAAFTAGASEAPEAEMARALSEQTDDLS